MRSMRKIQKKLVVKPEYLAILGVFAFFLFAVIVFPKKAAAPPPPDESPSLDLLPGETASMKEDYLIEVEGLGTVLLEEYISGVVAAEMPAAFESEALKAQAVAARTYAMRKLQSGAPLCTDSQHCQAYASDEALKERWGSDYAAYKAKVREAVYACAGEVLSYEGKLINALYFSSSGGRTENVANVFSGNLPYLVGVDSPEEVRVEEKSFSASEFVALANEAFPEAKLKDAGDMEILSRYESGIVAELRIGSATVSGKDARFAFSLRSANFTFTAGKDGVTFKTRGYGHGVGMSQYGANALAKSGATYEEILLHYYSGAALQNLTAAE